MEKVCNYFGEQRFRVWCQKVLPTVYDDSLSYYELLCKVLRVLQEFSTELSTFEGFVNETLVTDVVDISERLDAVAEKVEKAFNAVGGEVAYLGYDVDMSDIPEDTGLVVGNGTSDEPYNSFEAGGSKVHGGWIRVGSKVVPQSDFERFTDKGFMFGDTELTEDKVKVLNRVSEQAFEKAVFYPKNNKFNIGKFWGHCLAYYTEAYGDASYGAVINTNVGVAGMYSGTFKYEATGELYYLHAYSEDGSFSEITLCRVEDNSIVPLPNNGSVSLTLIKIY